MKIDEMNLRSIVK